MKIKLCRRYFVKLLICCALVMLTACDDLQSGEVIAPEVKPTVNIEPSMSVVKPTVQIEPGMSVIKVEMSPEATKTPIPTNTPEPTPTPTPQSLTLGAVGDIIITGAHMDAAATEDGSYNFTPIFHAFTGLFQQTDIMCGNLETVLGGAEAGYSSGESYEDGKSRFSAPDKLVDDLMAGGFDVLTTANNHCLDKGRAGLYRTIGVLREKGIVQTGTFLDAADRDKPCIIERNGIKVGIVATTKLINNRPDNIERDEGMIAISQMLTDNELSSEIKRDIQRTREAGADFIVLFAHWDNEDSEPADSDTRRYAEQLLALGADCILGSHPHRVKEAEYLTVDRGGEAYTGLVVYSMGNFIANEGFECSVGLYVQITLTRDLSGRVSLTEACYMPSFSFRLDTEVQRSFYVLPAYASIQRLGVFAEQADEKVIELLIKAREHAISKVGGVEGFAPLDAEGK